MKIMLGLTLIVLLMTASVDDAQTKHYPSTSNRSAQEKWSVFLSLDNSFRVETPLVLHRIEDMYGDSDPNGYKSIDVYGAEEAASKGRAYLVVALTPSESMRKENPNENNLRGLQFVIGGDDAEPLSETVISVNGMRAKEFTYNLSRYEGGGYRKGRIIDAGERIIILVFRGNTLQDLSSQSAVRFFNSFQLLPTKHGGP